MSLLIKIAIGVTCLVCGGYFSWCAVTGVWPENLEVVNEVEDAHCVAQFPDGSRWEIGIAEGETKRRLYLFGLPTTDTAVSCQSGQRPLFFQWEARCGLVSRIVVTDKDGVIDFGICH